MRLVREERVGKGSGDRGVLGGWERDGGGRYSDFKGFINDVLARHLLNLYFVLTKKYNASRFSTAAGYYT